MEFVRTFGPREQATCITEATYWLCCCQFFQQVFSNTYTIWQFNGAYVFTANQNNYFIIFKNEWCNFRGKL